MTRSRRFSNYEYRLPPKIHIPDEPKRMGTGYAEDQMDINQTSMVTGWHTVKMGHEDIYAFEVIAYVIGVGRSSRLFQGVKEKLGLVNAISAHLYNPACDPGDFTVSATCDFSNLKQAQQAVSRLSMG